MNPNAQMMQYLWVTKFMKLTPTLCTECVKPITTKPTCQSVCPITNTIITDHQHIETEEQLWDKFVAIHHADKI